MIKSFRGEYSWLSNFHRFEQPMRYQRIIFPTNEHFYIAMKTKDKALREKVAEHSPKGLKSFGKSLPLREDWDSIKLAVMEHGLRYKFSKYNPTLRQKLIGTRDCYIEEGNYWNDTFWGVDVKTGEGENHLGKLLMKIRGDIK